MKQWMLRILKYADRLIDDLDGLDWPENIKDQQRNWIGKRFGTEISFAVEGTKEEIVAFTTRPDTLFGVTFFVLAPEHPLVQILTSPEQKDQVEEYRKTASQMSELDRTIENRTKTGVPIGSYLINPINGDRIPIFIGDYVLLSYGTGAVMGVPAHDERDFEFARTFNLPIRPVVKPTDGSMKPEMIEAIVQGEVAFTEAGVMIDIEDQVANELHLAGKSHYDAKELITSWLEGSGRGRRVVNYKLRDWLFSRQRYWGEPIPIVHWEDGSISALEESELPLELPDVPDFKPSQDGESPLAKAGEWLKVSDPKTGKLGRRETNTMPNWAGSCWYYLRYLDPHNEEMAWSAEAEKSWMEVDLYVGGAEHAVLHLLYARFWHKVLYDLGHVTTKEPFKRLVNQGMILAHAYRNKRGGLVPVDEVVEKDGTYIHEKFNEEVERISAKMSKSLKNVVNPDQIVDEYGADTLRMHMMFMGPLQGTKMWDSKAIAGTHRFLKKAFRFVREGQECDTDSSDVLRERHRVISRVTLGLDDFQFNTPIAAMMEFLNHVANSEVSRETKESFVLLLAPFAPHLSEELWEFLGHSETLSYTKWPQFSSAVLTEDRADVVIQVNGKKRSLLQVSRSD